MALMALMALMELQDRLVPQDLQVLMALMD
jgi:hypothetical protein